MQLPPVVEPRPSGQKQPSNPLWWLVGIIAALLVGIPFVLFVYPTPYEYTRKGTDFYRVNRFSGVREVATAQGWQTEAEIAQKIASAQAAEQQRLDQAEQDAKQRLATPRTLPDIKIGSRSEVTAKCTTTFVDGTMQARIHLEPYYGTLEQAYHSTDTAFKITPEFLDQSNFKVASQDLGTADMVRVSDGSGGYTALEAEISIQMSADQYDRIASWNMTWVWAPPSSYDNSYSTGGSSGSDTSGY